MADPLELLKRAQKARELLKESQQQSQHIQCEYRSEKDGKDTQFSNIQSDSEHVDVNQLSKELDKLNRELEKLGIQPDLSHKKQIPPDETRDNVLEEKLGKKTRKKKDSSKQQKVLKKKSKKYEGKTYLYWWEITPANAKTIEQYDKIRFVRDDCGKGCELTPQKINKFLVEERRNNRGQRNWTVKVLKDKKNELAFSPGAGDQDWKFVKVVWTYGR